jgi:hypothetical protein
MKMLPPVYCSKCVQILLAAMVLMTSCKKQNDAGEANHMKATVVYRNGTSLVLDETGTKVLMTMGQYGTVFSAAVVNNNGDMVTVSEGWGEPYCIFEPYDISLPEPYVGIRSLGYVFQFTDSSGNYREGNFDFQCVMGIPGTDTVRVYGNFSGYVE